MSHSDEKSPDCCTNQAIMMPKPCDDKTGGVVFWAFHLTNMFLYCAILVAERFVDKQNPFDLVTAQVFLWGMLFTFLGAKAGGYLGAVMEEDACSTLDMGVLSAMGSFIGATILGLIGTVLPGLYLVLPSHWLTIPLGFLVFGLWIFHSKKTISIQRLTAIDCCGNRLDSDGKVLTTQPMKMKNKIAALLAFTLVMWAFLTVLMVIVMKRDLANHWMLGGMMYGMGGAMVGGMLGGWCAGLLDMHTGEPEHNNPIMVCAMALMAGMMGGMGAGMVGGMMPLMGALTITPTIVLPLVLLVICYFWLFRREFTLEWKSRVERQGVIWLGSLLWEKL